MMKTGGATQIKLFLILLLCSANIFIEQKSLYSSLKDDENQKKNALPSSLKDDKNQKKKALPPIHWGSSWVGNQWIPPPGYKTYSPKEIRGYFSDHSVLVVGDSTARRTFGTWYGLINTPNINDVHLDELDASHIIDVNKKKVTEVCEKEGYSLCRSMPGSTSSSNGTKDNSSTEHECNHYSLTCLSSLPTLLDPSSIIMRDLSHYSMVLFIMGPWEFSEMWECAAENAGRRNSTEDFFKGLVNLTALYPNTKFLWRTWSGPGATHTGNFLQNWQNAQAHNHFVKTLIHKYQMEQYNNNKQWTQISYIDWGQAMGPRLFPESIRIKGDIDNHHGLGARLAFIQMWVNHLVEQERQEKWHLEPWWVTIKGAEAASSDCAQAGWSPAYCLDDELLASKYESFLTLSKPVVELTPEEAEALAKLEADFCADCLWNPEANISCGHRLNFMIGNYKLARYEALTSVTQTSACNKSSIKEPVLS